MAPQPPTGGQPKPGQAFGFTGIRTERYTRWSGELGSRRRIVSKMIGSSVVHDIKNPGVIILIVLAWIFSVLFTVLTAGFGGLSLEMDADAGFDIGRFINDNTGGKQGVDISLHQVIMNDSQAEFDLAGLSPTYETQFTISNIPSGWSAFVNQSSVGGMDSATLVVTPPMGAYPMDTAMIDVEARTGGRVDRYRTVTTIAPDPMMTMMRFGMIIEFDGPETNGTAGEWVSVGFSVTNTGTVADSYNVTITSKPSGWKVKALVNGSEVEVKVKKVQTWMQGMPQTISYRTFVVAVPPGEKMDCALELKTKTTSAKSNSITLAGNSQNDPFVFGTYSVTVNLKDTEKTDLTSRILFDQVMAMQVLWTLFLAAVVGSKMIATDLDEKSYNLYFARPITKADYLVGKFGTLNMLLSLVTMVPTLVTYLLLILLSDLSDTYVWDHMWVWGAIVVQSLVVMLTFSTLSLAFSSLTSRRFYAAAAFVVIFIASTIIAQILIGGFGIEEGPLASLNDNFDIIGRTVFDLSDDLSIEFPWWYSVLVLVPMWCICGLLVWLKVEKTELSE